MKGKAHNILDEQKSEAVKAVAMMELVFTELRRGVQRWANLNTHKIQENGLKRREVSEHVFTIKL